jgi:hypothetical protein
LGPCWPSLSASVFPEAVACHLKEVTHRNRCRNMLKYVQIMGHSTNKMNDIVYIYNIYISRTQLWQLKWNPTNSYKLKVLIAKGNIIIPGFAWHFFRSLKLQVIESHHFRWKIATLWLWHVMTNRASHGKSPCEWENSLFRLGHFQVRTLVNI